MLGAWQPRHGPVERSDRLASGGGTGPAIHRLQPGRGIGRPHRRPGAHTGSTRHPRRHLAQGNGGSPAQHRHVRLGDETEVVTADDKKFLQEAITAGAGPDFTPRRKPEQCRRSPAGQGARDIGRSNPETRRRSAGTWGCKSPFWPEVGSGRRPMSSASTNAARNRTNLVEQQPGMTGQGRSRARPDRDPLVPGQQPVDDLHSCIAPSTRRTWKASRLEHAPFRVQGLGPGRPGPGCGRQRSPTERGR